LPRMQKGLATLIGRALAASVLATTWAGVSRVKARRDANPRGIATSISCCTWQGPYDLSCGSSSLMSSWRHKASRPYTKASNTAALVRIPGVGPGAVGRITDHTVRSGGDPEAGAVKRPLRAATHRLGSAATFGGLAARPARRDSEIGQLPHTVCRRQQTLQLRHRNPKEHRWETSANHCESRNLRIYGQSRSRRQSHLLGRNV
jgi:hypothetical protein